MCLTLKLYGLLLLFLVVANGKVVAQDPTEQLFDAISKNENIVIQDYRITEGDVNNLVFLFESALPQFNRSQRYISYFYIQRIALGFENADAQSRLLDFIVRVGLKDADLGNRTAAINLLYAFPGECFTNAIKNTIASYVAGKEEPLIDYVKLAGWAKIGHVEVLLLELLRDGELSKQANWVVQLALGRIGNPESIQYCMEMIRSSGMNDLVVHSLVPDIVYLNQREAIDYLLIKILDEEKLCSSPNPEVELSINCAYRLMEAVAPVIVDFPIELDASGDLLVDDYDEALRQVREWIQANYQSYQIKE